VDPPQAGCEKTSEGHLKCPIFKSDQYEEGQHSGRFCTIKDGDILRLETFKEVKATTFDLIKVFGGRINEWKDRYTLSVTSVSRVTKYEGKTLDNAGLFSLWHETMFDCFQITRPTSETPYRGSNLILNVNVPKEGQTIGSFISPPSLHDGRLKVVWENKETLMEECMIGGAPWLLQQQGKEGDFLSGVVDLGFFEVDKAFGINDPETWKVHIGTCLSHMKALIPAYVSVKDREKIEGNSLNDVLEPKPMDPEGNILPYSDFSLSCHAGRNILVDKRYLVEGIGYEVSASFVFQTVFNAVNTYSSPFYEKNSWNKAGSHFWNLTECNIPNVQDFLNKKEADGWAFYIVPDCEIDEEDASFIKSMDIQERETVFQDGKRERGQMKKKLNGLTQVYMMKKKRPSSKEESRPTKKARTK